MAETSAMFGGVLLVILFRSIERTGELYLRHDRPTQFSRAFELGDCLTGGGFLFMAREENRGAIAVSNIRSLTIERGGIMNLEEKVNQSRIGHHGRLKFDLHHFGMASGVRTHLLISRIFRRARPSIPLRSTRRLALL